VVGLSRLEPALDSPQQPSKGPDTGIDKLVNPTLSKW